MGINNNISVLIAHEFKRFVVTTHNKIKFRRNDFNNPIYCNT